MNRKSHLIDLPIKNIYILKLNYITYRNNNILFSKFVLNKYSKLNILI